MIKKLITLFLFLAIIFLITNKARAEEISWPLFRHDPQRTGRGSFFIPQITKTKLINFLNETITDSEGTTYHIINETGRKGVLASFSDGSQKWFHPTESQPHKIVLGKDGTIFVLEGQGARAINPDGSLKWRNNRIINNYPEKSPLLSETHFYVIVACRSPSGNYGNCLLALNNETGQIDWFYSIVEDKTYYSEDDFSPMGFYCSGTCGVNSPSLGLDNTIYFGSRNFIYAINPDGTKKWQREFVQGNVEIPIVITEEKGYVVVYNEKPCPPDEEICHSTCLHVFNLENPLIDEWNLCFSGLAFFGTSLALSPDGTIYTFYYYWPRYGWCGRLGLISINPLKRIKTLKHWDCPSSFSSPITDLSGNVYVKYYNQIFGFNLGGEVLTCVDGIKNGDETDIDCGGSCFLCENGKSCNLDSDCESDYCNQGVCSPKPAKWSFAVITDLHIGRQYQKEYQGQDYYLTERLKNVVKWINENKDEIKCGEESCPLKFITLLGDITKNTSISGFCKTKEILDNLKIPYITVFGNHDVGTDEEYKQCSRWRGQDYFDQVFWSTTSIPCQNATSTKNFEVLLRKFNFQRDEKNKDYKNFSFSYGGINFIGLDFNSREKFMGIFKGVGPDAVLNEINKNWLKEKLEELKENPIILLAHHPFTKKYFGILDFSKGEFDEIKKLLSERNTKINFGGHIHNFEELHGIFAPKNANIKYDSIETTQVLTTEALMVGSNGRGVEKETEENGVKDGKKGIIRIIKIFENQNIDPYNWETTEKGDEFLAFNPKLNFGFSLRRYLNFPCVELEADSFTEKPFTILWDFGDNTTSSEKEYTKCYNTQGKYKIILNLKDLNSNFTESISKEVEIKEGIIPRTIKNIEEYLNQGIDFISETAQMSLRKIGQIKTDVISIFKKKSPLKLIGKIMVHFEKLSDDLDLTRLNADTDSEKQKTILYMENWPSEIERSKILFIPVKND